MTVPSLSSLTLESKIAIALGALGGVEGLPELMFVDGPNGVRGTMGATAYPSCLVLAATFDRALAEEYGRSVAGEVVAAGANVLLGPGFDLLRSPWAGRSAESFGEDPLLAGVLGGGVVRGLQGAGVLSIAKHFVANNFETLRTGSGSVFSRGDAVDVHVDDAPLHDLYLEPFRRAVQDDGLLGLMTSYNRLRGRYVAESADLLDAIRRDWSFAGVFAPDFIFAVRDPEAALAAGLDLPGLGGASGRTEEMVRALAPTALDALVSRWLHVTAALPLLPARDPAPDSLGTPDALALAERIAVAGTVLLQNDGTLPLGQGIPVALLAPSTLDHLLVTGGSASVGLEASRMPDLAEELRALGVDVRAADPGVSDLPVSVVTAADAVDGTLEMVVDGASTSVETLEYRAPAGRSSTVTVDTVLRARASGLHRLSVTGAGQFEVRLGDGAPVRGWREASPMIVGPEYPLQLVAALDEGESIRLRLSYETAGALDIPDDGFAPGFAVGWQAIQSGLDEARALAEECEVAVIIVGRVAGETMDLDGLRLPPAQEALIESVLATGRPTVVAILGAGPVVVPFRERLAAVLHLGNPGERGAAALAAVLAGEAEPGGRLPFSMPLGEEQVAIERVSFPRADLRVDYREGHAVGYRSEAAVAYPFGHGLGYGSVQWGAVTVSPAADGVVVMIEVTNSSARATTVVPQVYARRRGAGVPRALVAFTTAVVGPGETGMLSLPVTRHDLATWDATARARIAQPGSYELWVGPSATSPHAVERVDLR